MKTLKKPEIIDTSIGVSMDHSRLAWIAGYNQAIKDYENYLEESVKQDGNFIIKHSPFSTIPCKPTDLHR